MAYVSESRPVTTRGQLPAVIVKQRKPAWEDAAIDSMLVARQPPGQALLRYGVGGIVLFFAFFAVWGKLAPLNSAAIAPGILQAEGGGRKVVQHLEGGIVKEILVREGESVTAGQIIVQLDTTQSQAQDASVQSQYDTLIAENARLAAEALSAERISFPSAMQARQRDLTVSEIMSGQQELFNRRRQSILSQLEILEQRIQQSDSEINGYKAQIKSADDQMKLIGEEIGTVSALVEQGYERKTRLLSLQRQLASLQGQRGQITGNIARVERLISESRAQKVSVRDTQLSEIATQQRQVQERLNIVGERLKTTGDVRQRSDIRAPVDGRIVNLRTVTKGGVVAPGQEILDIVPLNVRIVVLARLKANDVESVQDGMTAEVRLSPYKSRLLPLIKGKVTRVAADVTVDELTGQMYYETEIVLDAKELSLLKDVHMVSGMPTESFIDLGKRSLFSYLTQPLVDSFQRSFREP